MLPGYPRSGWKAMSRKEKRQKQVLEMARNTPGTRVGTLEKVGEKQWPEKRERREKKSVQSVLTMAL